VKNLLSWKQKITKQSGGAKVKRVYTLRFYMLILSGAIAAFGVGLFIVYFNTLNQVAGGAGFLMIAAGGFAFRYYWKKEGDIAKEQIAGAQGTQEPDANCLNIYPNKVEFAIMANPSGFPMRCLNLNKSYFVNIFDGKNLVPFVLPDQQYYDPIVFAQRVLGLPAHKKIFERKPKLMQKLKTMMLVVAIIIVWLLILTTTGQGG